MAIAILTRPTLTRGFIYSDDSNKYTWGSTSSSNNGYYTLVQIVNTNNNAVIYNGKCFSFEFYLKDVLTNFIKLNPAMNFSHGRVHIILTEKWVSSGGIQTGAQVNDSANARYVLKGIAGNYALRQVSGYDLLSNIPRGANYYTVAGYNTQVTLKTGNTTSNIVNTSTLTGQLGLNELEMDCDGTAAQLVWRNNYSANDSFIFGHNFETEITSKSIRWGYPNERDIVRELSRGFTLHSGYINKNTYRWLVEELTMSPYVILNINSYDSTYHTQKNLSVRVNVDMNSATYEMVRHDNDLINLSVKVSISEKYKSIRI